MPSADVGGAWLIFALHPVRLAVLPADGDGHHELYLMCDDIQTTLADLRGKGVRVAQDVSDQGCGLLAAISLPDGSELPVYEPRHPSPIRPDGRSGHCGRQRLHEASDASGVNSEPHGLNVQSADAVRLSCDRLVGRAPDFQAPTGVPA
jgi:hypothetical protein